MILSLIREIEHIIRQHLQLVSFGITAVSIMLLGPMINRSVKKLCSSLHWLLRYIVFIVLCTAGYSFLGHLLYFKVTSLLSGLSGNILIVWVLVIYLILAWFAKQEKAI